MNKVPAVNQPDGPLFVFAQLEAVKDDGNGQAIVTDSKFIVTSNTKVDDKPIGKHGVLVFTRREFAEQCLRVIGPKPYIIAGFYGAAHLKECLNQQMELGYDSVIINRHSGVDDESTIAIRELIRAMG